MILRLDAFGSLYVVKDINYTLTDRCNGNTITAVSAGGQECTVTLSELVPDTAQAELLWDVLLAKYTLRNFKIWYTQDDTFRCGIPGVSDYGCSVIVNAHQCEALVLDGPYAFTRLYQLKDRMLHCWLGTWLEEARALASKYSFKFINCRIITKQ